MLKLKQIQGVEILTVIDNYMDVFLPSTDEVNRWPLFEEDHLAPPLLSEHGLCLFIKIYDEAEKHFLLLDSGYTNVGCLYNMDIMKISLENVGVFVLSHGHFDHIGALYDLYEKKYLKKGTPMYLHSKAFSERGLKHPSGDLKHLPQISDPERVIANRRSTIANRQLSIANRQSLLSFGRHQFGLDGLVDLAHQVDVVDLGGGVLLEDLRGHQLVLEFLDDACDGDSELRAEVESLLEHHDEASIGFMRPPAHDSEATLRSVATQKIASPLLGQRGPQVLRGDQTGPGFTPPLFQTGDDTIAPGGGTFIGGDRYPAWKNRFLFAGLLPLHD